LSSGAQPAQRSNYDHQHILDLNSGGGWDCVLAL